VAVGVLRGAGSVGPAWLAGAAGIGLHYILPLAGFALSIWGFVEIGFLHGTAEPNRYGPNPLALHLTEG
jgi:uncharacterized membrane protein YhaH (DUF805 family)